MRPFFYIANWKMAMNLHDAKVFVENLQQDTLLAKNSATTVILCPSFPLLHSVKKRMLSGHFFLGAQTCSAFDSGPYTGQVSAAMLAESGCTYCLIGHSERRSLLGETSEDVAKQYTQLTTNAITPIICIGETAEQYQAKKTLLILEEQLTPIIKTFKQIPAEQILIAYEPVWAIGSGTIPATEELITVFAWLKDFVTTQCKETNVYLIYGGSVDATNKKIISCLDAVDGLLIGSASLDFQKFKNIVL